LSHAEAFHRRLFELAGAPDGVLDLGCGMHPLSWPWAGEGEPVRRYVAVDSDVRAMRAVDAFARFLEPGRLTALRGSLAGDSWRTGGEEFSLALMLKVVPVLQRLDPQAAAALHAIPARCLCVTGNVEALTRRKRVETRERRVLDRYVEATGREVIGELRVGPEFGYVLR
jgi:16S rRNA (guanine(1405)-N(7))-methyltransferase